MMRAVNPPLRERRELRQNLLKNEALGRNRKIFSEISVQRENPLKRAGMVCRYGSTVENASQVSAKLGGEPFTRISCLSDCPLAMRLIIEERYQHMSSRV